MPFTLPLHRAPRHLFLGILALASLVLLSSCGIQLRPADAPVRTVSARTGGGDVGSPRIPSGPDPVRDVEKALGEGGDEPRSGSEASRRPSHNFYRIITPDAESRRGLFTTHRLGRRLFYEIPDRELGQDMLLLRRAVGGGSEGTSHVVRWERHGDRILLREQWFDAVADPTATISGNVREITRGPIIAEFDIEATGPDGALIDVTRLFTRNVPEFVGVRSISGARSMVKSAVAHPDNIEVEALQTGTVVPPGAPVGTTASTNSVTFHWSMLRLPPPMMPRLHDPRVGYNSVRHIDYAAPNHGSATMRYIRRFRLEKADPERAVSDPVSPIVFWIDPGTPEWLVPWVARGIEAWQPAYKEAGFSNAIVARRAPTREEDPDWSIYDARHSVVYWRPSTRENANGGQVADPRTGEILKAEVNMFHNVMNLLQSWYFIQASPLDVRARELPLPDSLMGRLVEYVVSHEVGHAIGLPHNMKSSSAYPADSLRSVTFLEKKGAHVSTLMDYSRFNYVAQPEDGIPPELLIPKVGPYDRFAIAWGHRPIPGATTPEEERETLNEWTKVQDSIPWLRFETRGGSHDPGNLTEAVGSADAVHSSTLGMRNLERVMEYLLPATERPGRDHALLEELYGDAVAQWGRYLGHVAAIIGGADSQERMGIGDPFVPVSVERQRQAASFLGLHAFRPPPAFIDREILRRIETESVVRRIGRAQERVLDTLLNDARLNRMIEYETLAQPGTAYTISDLMADIRGGVWTELAEDEVRIDIYRRNLQRTYLESVDRQLNGSLARSSRRRATSDARPILREELRELEVAVGQAIERAADSMTRLHLRDVEAEIGTILKGA